jgi:hypothetical protein
MKAYVDVPPGGCQVAVSCEVWVRATAPFQLSREAPVVRQTPEPGTDVLSVEASSLPLSAASPEAWIVRLIAFEPGDAATPPLRVELLDAAGRPTIVDVPGRAFQVRAQTVAPDATLADLEPLTPAVEAIIAQSALVLSGALIVTALVMMMAARRRRAIAWLRTVLAAARMRRRAARLLRSGVANADPPSVYDRIVEAVRLALTPCFGPSVHTLTSSEVVALVTRSRMAETDRRTLAELLAASDVVRFGGHLPSQAEAAAALDRARAIVRSRDLAARAAKPSASRPSTNR